MLCAPGPAAVGSHLGGVGQTHRRAAPDNPQPGTGQELPDLRGARPAAGTRQGAGDRSAFSPELMPT